MWPALGCLFATILLLALAGAVVIVGQVLGALFDPIGALTRPIAVVAFLVLLLAVVGLVRGFRRLAEPTNALVDAARRVERGEYGTRVPEVRRAPRELRELARAFNTMASRLERDQAERRSLLADVSHELRTPLAILRGNLEAIADGVHEPDEAHVAGLIEETRVLERLVDDLRTLSLAEAGSLPLHREPTDPDVLLGETLESFRGAADLKRVSLRLDAPDDLPLLDVDPVRIREVVGNLLANAIRHTPAGGTITASGFPATGGGGRAGLGIRIADTGEGMDPDLVPHVFERFARSEDSPGSGLGLAIAWNLVTAHGGTIDVESAPGTGTTFDIWLPLDVVPTGEA